MYTADAFQIKQSLTDIVQMYVCDVGYEINLVTCLFKLVTSWTNLAGFNWTYLLFISLILFI